MMCIEEPFSADSEAAVYLAQEGTAKEPMDRSTSHPEGGPSYKPSNTTTGRTNTQTTTGLPLLPANQMGAAKCI